MRILIHELKMVALSCPTTVNFCLSGISLRDREELNVSSSSRPPNLPRKLFRFRGCESSSPFPLPFAVDTLIGSRLPAGSAATLSAVSGREK